MWIVAQSLTISTVFVAACFLVSWFGRYSGRAACLAVGAALLSVPFLAFVWFFQSLATALLSFVVWFSGIESRRAALAALLLPLAATYFYVGRSTMAAIERVDRLRDQFPLVSLAPRLAYERDRPTSGDATAAVAGLPAEVETRLAEREQSSGDDGFRKWQLRRLHDGTTNDFITAAGFGVVRMPEVTQEALELPMGESQPRPAALPEYDPTASPANPGGVPAPTRKQALATHAVAEKGFVDAERSGYVESLEKVAGFEPHGFLSEVAVQDQVSDRTWDQYRKNIDWVIVRLELVSLLKHDPPAAYLSKNLPKMDELQNAATRPLDAFERAALEKLRRVDDVVVEDGPDGVRMLGALRAGKDCLACHRAERGELLGAFSYELRPSRPPPRLPAKPADPQARLRRETDSGLASR
jgi:hypothetical protein